MGSTGIRCSCLSRFTRLKQPLLMKEYFFLGVFGGTRVRIHPHDLLLQELAAAPTEDRQKCLDHLLECADCQAKLQTLLAPRPTSPPERVVLLEHWQLGPANYTLALDKISRRLRRIEAAYERERADAPGLYAELAPYPAERQKLLVRNCPRFQTWGFCELLLLRSQELNFQDPSAAEKLALLALEALDYLDASIYGAETLEDLRARAWAYVANSRRVKADFCGAEAAFALAFASLKRGTSEPMEKALLLDLKASLLTTQRQYPKALGLLRRAVAIFLEVGEKHRAGRAMVKMSTANYFMGEQEQAIRLLYQSLELIDLTREPRLLLVAWHNLIDNLAELGKFMEAHKLLVKARPLYRRFSEPWSRHPRRWVEGRIARGLGQLEQAESFLLAARDGFLAEGSAYDTTLVFLDLASLYSEQGRSAEVKQIAEEMLPIFSSRQLPGEAIAALTFWRQAVQAEQTCLKLVNSIAAFLKRVRHNPELRFQTPE